MATWRLDSRDLAGTLVKQGLTFQRATARWILNSAGSIEVDFDLYELAAADLQPGEHELVLLRDGVRAWGGYAWDVDADVDAETIKFTGEGYASMLRDRRVTSDLIYTVPPLGAALNQQQIAWNLISHTMAQADGNVGFTQGTHTGGNVTRERAYCANERPNVYESLEELTEYDDGLDWEIDADKAFNTWQPQRKAASGITFNGNNVDGISYSNRAREVLTYVSAIGEGDCTPPLADVSDATQALKYKRRHGVIQARTSKQAEVTAQANEELRAKKRSSWAAKVHFREDASSAPPWGSYHVGDTFTLTDDRGYATFSVSLRILEIALTLEPPSFAIVEIAADSAVD